MAVFPIFRATSGLNNIIEANHLRYTEGGKCPLAAGVNVIIDDAGGVRRRKGIDNKFSGASHSLWSWGPYCFFVSDGDLYRYLSDETVVKVYADCGDDKLHFEEFGGRVYCSNGSFKAILKDMTISSWSASVPQQYRSDTRVFGLPENFTKIFAHAGRMYLVDGIFLWESEPHNPSCVQLSRDPMQFGSGIIDAVSVKTGIYLSTAYDVKFLEGTSREDFVVHDIYDSPMVAGTATRIAGSAIAEGNFIEGMAAIWVSKNGVCVGSDRGRVYNFTDRSLVFDNAILGTSAAIPGQYFFSLEVE